MVFRIFIFLILSSSCGSVWAHNNPEITSLDVTYCQFAKDPSAFSGKRIRIRAVYSYMDEISTLKPPMCCPDPNVKIWVDFDEALKGRSRKLYLGFPKGMGFVLAIFVGKIESGKVYGPFGERFRLVVDEVERVEKKANRPAGRIPAWVPQNCENSGVGGAAAASKVALDKGEGVVKAQFWPAVFLLLPDHQSWRGIEALNLSLKSLSR